MCSSSDVWNFLFIEEIEKHPILWKSEYIGLDVSSAQNEAWSEIAIKFGLNVSSCKIKWRMLHQNIQDKVKKSSYEEFRKWDYYPKIIFLLNERVDISEGAQSNLVERRSEYNLNITKREDDITIEEVPIIKIEPDDSITEDTQDSFIENTAVQEKSIEETSALENFIEKTSAKENPDFYVDANYCFLMSIIPIVQSRPPSDKGKLKSKIQQLVYDEAFNEDFDV